MLKAHGYLVFAPFRSLLNEHPPDVQQSLRQSPNAKKFQFLANIAPGSPLCGNKWLEKAVEADIINVQVKESQVIFNEYNTDGRYE